jgi:hypothetical protein
MLDILFFIQADVPDATMDVNLPGLLLTKQVRFPTGTLGLKINKIVG